MKNELISCVFILLIITSCEKEKSKDFRDKYVGKYQVVEKFNSYGPVNTCGDFYSISDTTIYVEYGNSDSTISILGWDLYVDTSGQYSGYHLGVKFRNDSIKYLYMNGGLGCGVWERYEGYKIK